ncbi:hypothetical protein, partial [Sulfitobacter donghicola]|uniref:hypothetical protein n=1 Tax=Sulfitobacter donghicola TaxID=421000 RepID=UPI001C3F2155
MKHPVLAVLAVALVGCGTAPQNDLIYQQLLANPPTEIPDRHLDRLRQGRFSCDVLNEGQSDQYMLCYRPQDGLRPVQTAYLSYFQPN